MYGNHFPEPLTNEEEKMYIKRLQNGDIDVRNVLIERNLRLTAHIAKRFADSGYESDELISVGTVGLIKGVQTFDAQKKVKLATYCSKCIENEILMYLRREKKYLRIESLEEPIIKDSEGNEVCLGDIISDQAALVEDRFTEQEKYNMLYKLLNVLDERDKLVIILNFGLFNHKRRNQREIAEIIGISRSYVSRIIQRSLKRMKLNAKYHEYDTLIPLKNSAGEKMKKAL